MADIKYTSRAPLALDRIDLTTDADAPLLRLCTLLGQLRSIAEELESVVSAMPARTILGRRMKDLSL